MARHYAISLLVATLSLAGCVTDPHRDMTLAMQGLDALDSGDTGRAEELLNQALATNPDNPYALANLSKLYMKQGRYDMAKPLCEKMVARESDGAGGESPEVAGLVQEARENLELIRREEAVDQELLALAPTTPSPPGARDPAPTATPLVREAPAPVVALQTPTRTPPTAARYRIQVGAFRSPEGAQRLSRRLGERYAELLREKEVLLTESNGLTRVQVGPYQSLSEASDACRTFSRGGLRCFPRAR